MEWKWSTGATGWSTGVSVANFLLQPEVGSEISGIWNSRRDDGIAVRPVMDDLVTTYTGL